MWFGRDRTQATLDEFFRTELRWGQRQRIEAACVDMWQAFTNSITQWAPHCRIVYDKFHVMQHANAVVDETRRAEFVRKGGRARQVVKANAGCRSAAGSTSIGPSDSNSRSSSR